MSFRSAPFRSHRRNLAALSLALGFVAGGASPHVLAQDRPTRPVATTLRMPADGVTLNYKVAPAFGGLFFDQPVHVIYAPGETQRAFVVERPGRIAIVRDTAAPTREVFLDISTRIGTATPDHGLISAVFHPRFAENGYFYAWFSIYVNGQRANRLARFRVSTTNPAVADPASETPLITQLTGPGGHDGGTLLFGPDGYLYLSLGDGDRNLPEVNAANQRIDRGFFGAVIRIDVDQRAGSLPPNAHPSVHAGTYAVPADNPFIGATTFNNEAVTASAVRTEFWAVGLRNPWRMAFDSANGQLWCADVGLSTREEINLITRGANYGWDYREGLTAGPRTGTPPAGVTFTDPLWDYPVSQGLSITGGIVYRGSKYADLVGRYLFADWVSGRIWALADNGARPLPATQVRQIANEPGLTGFTLDPRTGEVLLADFDSNQIKRLIPNPNAGGPALPATLSETGLFSNVITLTPATGVIPYFVNAPFWSDGAEKTRWFAMPDGTSVFRFAADGNWALPTGTVWVKHFGARTSNGRFPQFLRLETRVLVKTADGVYGATYRWNDEQSEATLVPEQGGFRTYTFYGDNGAAETRNWTFPSRNDCLTCHTEKGGHALGFNTRQLNRAPIGTPENQLVTFSQAGYLDANLSPAEASSLPALIDPTNISHPLETRARSYLDANCSQCHQPGGTALGGWDARAATPFSLTNIINGPLTGPAPAAARVLVPGDATHSHLLQRMIGNGSPRMPPVGVNRRDTFGESLLTEWIADLARSRPPSRLLNVAARAQVGTGENVLIPGFVIAGAPKSVLVRAVGPTLGAFGVSDTLNAPVLTMYDSDQRIVARNTGWTTVADPTTVRAAALRVGAFALGDNSVDSALLLTLPPGAYSAQASGAGDTTGIALVEVYDADAGGGAGRLINTAIRGRVGTGANILIPGLVVSEGAAKKVLIRAIGPGLTAFGVPGALARPVVTLFSGRLPYLTNTAWNTAANAADIRTTAQAVGAFALAEGSADSALLVTLSPGAYSVQVSGVADSTGVALVEVYEVP